MGDREGRGLGADALAVRYEIVWVRDLTDPASPQEVVATFGLTDAGVPWLAIVNPSDSGPRGELDLWEMDLDDPWWGVRATWRAIRDAVSPLLARHYRAPIKLTEVLIEQLSWAMSPHLSVHVRIVAQREDP